MKQLMDIPFNIPAYRDIRVGDLIVYFDPSSIAHKGNVPCHCHLFKVIDKETRSSKMYVKTLSCYHEVEEMRCEQHSLKDCEINYSELKKYSRMMTKAVEVLFGDSHEHK